MRMGTIAGLGGSAVLGLAALLLARHVGPKPAEAAPALKASTAGTPMVVASGAIAYGTRIEPRLLTVIRAPKEAVPDGAFTTIAQVMNQDHGGAPVTLTALAAHEPLLPAKLSGPGARQTVAAAISEGMRAYTIAVNEVAGGGGHVLPGDRVDVLLAREVGGNGLEGSSDKRYRSDLVIQNVRVLGMDLDADPASNKPFTAKTATLEVDVEDAQKLALAGQAGTLSLALRRSGATDIAAPRPVSVADLGGGSAPAAVASAAPRPRLTTRRIARATPVAAPAGGTITVVHGATSAEVRVPSERGAE